MGTSGLLTSMGELHFQLLLRPPTGCEWKKNLVGLKNYVILFIKLNLILVIFEFVSFVMCAYIILKAFFIQSLFMYV